MTHHDGYEICKETGALKSISREITAHYDHAYVARYENYPQKELSKIRSRIVMEHAKQFDNICDVGFGTGAFLFEIGHGLIQLKVSAAYSSQDSD